MRRTQTLFREGHAALNNGPSTRCRTNQVRHISKVAEVAAVRESEGAQHSCAGMERWPRSRDKSAPAPLRTGLPARLEFERGTLLAQKARSKTVRHTAGAKRHLPGQTACPPSGPARVFLVKIAPLTTLDALI